MLILVNGVLWRCMLRAVLWAVAMIGILRAPQDVGDLTAAQRAAIERGESVLRTRSQADSPWPAVTVFLFVHASPEEAAAVFLDYGLQQSYIPRVKRSNVSRVIDATTVEVDYVVEVPFVSDEEYTVRNRVTRDGANGLRVDWTLVRASSTKATVGHVRFAPYQNSRTERKGTLLEYHNFVTPGSRLAGLGFIKKRAMQQVEETARAVARRVESERKLEGAMAERVAKLWVSLATSGRDL